MFLKANRGPFGPRRDAIAAPYSQRKQERNRLKSAAFRKVNQPNFGSIVVAHSALSSTSLSITPP